MFLLLMLPCPVTVDWLCLSSQGPVAAGITFQAESPFTLWLCEWLVVPCCWDKPRAIAPLSVAFSNPVYHLLNCSEISNLACSASFQGLFENRIPD